jgi:hypothetical protein
MTKKATAMILEANFDIDQIGGKLEWSFSRKDGDGNPIKGKYAGGIYFTTGEVMRVRVKAGSWTKLTSFKVLDCTLITLPQIVELEPKKKAKFAPPSIFVSTTAPAPEIKVIGASINLPGNEFEESVGPLPEPGAYSEISRQWDKHLTVGQTEGRWELSFVLTVRVEQEGKAPCERVFYFDPETEVGNGVSPP